MTYCDFYLHSAYSLTENTCHLSFWILISLTLKFHHRFRILKVILNEQKLAKWAQKQRSSFVVPIGHINNFYWTTNSSCVSLVPSTVRCQRTKACASMDLIGLERRILNSKNNLDKKLMQPTLRFELLKYK